MCHKSLISCSYWYQLQRCRYTQRNILTNSQQYERFIAIVLNRPLLQSLKAFIFCAVIALQYFGLTRLYDHRGFRLVLQTIYSRVNIYNNAPNSNIHLPSSRPASLCKTYFRGLPCPTQEYTLQYRTVKFNRDLPKDMDAASFDLKEDPLERKKQIFPVIDDPNIAPEDQVKLYDQWSQYYDQVCGSIHHVSFVLLPRAHEV